MYVLQNFNNGDIFYFQQTRSIVGILSMRSLNICGCFKSKLFTLLLQIFGCKDIDKYVLSKSVA